MSTGEVFGLGYRVLRVITFLILIFPLMSISVALKKKRDPTLGRFYQEIYADLWHVPPCYNKVYASVIPGFEC